LNQFSGSHDGPEIELSAPNQSELAAKEFMEGGGTRVEFALDSPFIEQQAAEPQGSIAQFLHTFYVTHSGGCNASIV